MNGTRSCPKCVKLSEHNVIFICTQTYGIWCEARGACVCVCVTLNFGKQISFQDLSFFCILEGNHCQRNHHSLKMRDCPQMLLVWHSLTDWEQCSGSQTKRLLAEVGHREEVKLNFPRKHWIGNHSIDGKWQTFPSFPVSISLHGSNDLNSLQNPSFGQSFWMKFFASCLVCTSQSVHLCFGCLNTKIQWGWLTGWWNWFCGTSDPCSMVLITIFGMWTPKKHDFWWVTMVFILIHTMFCPSILTVPHCVVSTVFCLTMVDSCFMVRVTVWAKETVVMIGAKLLHQCGCQDTASFIPGIVSKSFIQETSSGRKMKCAKAIQCFGSDGMKVKEFALSSTMLAPLATANTPKNLSFYWLWWHIWASTNPRCNHCEPCNNMHQWQCYSWPNSSIPTTTDVCLANQGWWNCPGIICNVWHSVNHRCWLWFGCKW